MGVTSTPFWFLIDPAERNPKSTGLKLLSNSGLKCHIPFQDSKSNLRCIVLAPWLSLLVVSVKIILLFIICQMCPFITDEVKNLISAFCSTPEIVSQAVETLYKLCHAHCKTPEETQVS